MSQFFRKRSDIVNWLEKYKISKYILIPDEKYGFIVDVNITVNLQSKNLNTIPIKFNKIKGSFNCTDNQLTSLEGCPEILSGSFNCQFNKLTDLNFCPKEIPKGFYCSHNELTSLKGCPIKIGLDFSFSNNKLSSLKYSPETVGRDFDCSYNQLNSLNFCPQVIKGFLNCSGNKIKNLNGFPKNVEGNFLCMSNDSLGIIQDITDFKIINSIMLAKKLNNNLANKIDTSVKIKI